MRETSGVWGNGHVRDTRHMSLGNDACRCASEQAKRTLGYMPRQIRLQVLRHVERNSLQRDAGYAVSLGLRAGITQSVLTGHYAGFTHPEAT